MMRTVLALTTCLGFVLAAHPGSGAETEPDRQPWEKFNVNAGVFISNMDTSFRLGSGVGIDIDAEELLGLDATSTVFRVDGSWRFTDNRRHRLDLSWFAVRRSGSRTVGKDFELEHPETGESVEMKALGVGLAVAILLESTEPSVRNSAVQRGFSDKSRIVRRATVDAAADSGLESFRSMFETALQDGDAWIRWKAVRSLGELGIGSSRSAIEDASEDDDFQVRFEAARVLKRE